MFGIDPTQKLTFVIPEGDGMIGLPRARLPCWFLAGKDDRQTIGVGDHVPINRFVECE